MPYEITTSDPNTTKIELWPHRSLPKRGFSLFILVTCGMFLIPLLGLLGTAFLWWMLPFMAGAVALVWWAIQRSYNDGLVIEALSITSDSCTLFRQGPKGQNHTWEANSYWVTVKKYESEGPVPQYVTLKGAGREVEIGPFLSEDERVALYDDLNRLIGKHTATPR